MIPLYGVLIWMFIIYVVIFIILSVIYRFLPKFKTKWYYIFLSSFLFALPFIIVLYMGPPDSDFHDIIFYMILFTTGGIIHGLLHFHFFVKKKQKKTVE